MGSLNTVKITWDDQDRPEITVTYGGEVTEEVADASTWLSIFAARLSDKSERCLRKLIEVNEDSGATSLASLADALGIEKKEVEGWNRNLGRVIKPVVREHGFLRPEQEDGTAQVFDFEWDENANQWRYLVPSKFRKVLLEELGQR